MSARKHLTAARKWSRKNLLLISTTIGVILGISLGFILRHYDVSDRTLTFVSLPGDLFMRALYLVIAPLIIISVICGISGVKSMNMGRTGLQIVTFYLATTASASVLGIVLGVLVKPGSFLSEEKKLKLNETNPDNIESYVELPDVILDLIRNAIPDSIVRSMFQTETTKYRWEDTGTGAGGSDNANGQRYIAYSNIVNFIGIIVFGILFGTALRQIGQKGEALFVCLTALNDVLMQIVIYVMWYSPIGIVFLIAGNIAMIENVEHVFGSLFIVSATVLLGLLIHFIFLNGVYFALTRKNPLQLMAGMKDSTVIAIATASSCAALPTTLRCLNKNCGVRSDICQLVLPIGATINMDAGAIHASLVVVYIAQLHNITLTFGTLIKIAFYTALNSIGAAAIPNSFFTALLITLKATDLPLRDVGMLFVVEWFLDRIKTALNVYGDCVGASIVNHWKSQNLKEISETETERVKQRKKSEEDSERISSLVQESQLAA